MRQTLTSYIFLTNKSNSKKGINRIFFILLFVVICAIPQQVKADNAELIMTKITEWIKLNPTQTNISAYIYNNNVHITGMSSSFFQLDLNAGITEKWDVAYVTASIVTTLFNLSRSEPLELIGRIVNIFGSPATIKMVRESFNAILPEGGFVNSTTPAIYRNNTTDKREFSRSNITPTCGNLRVWLSPRIKG